MNTLLVVVRPTALTSEGKVPSLNKGDQILVLTEVRTWM